MATVRLTTTVPSTRIALARMLSEHGHRLIGPDEPMPATVWVVDLPDDGPLEAVLTAATSTVGLVVLSDDPRVVGRLTGSRPAGWACLPRDVDAMDLDLAVRATEAGHVLLDHVSFAALTGPRTAICRPARVLTAREEQVLHLVAEGLPNKGIARALGVSENTVKFHVASICAKLDARSRTEAVTLAARDGLLTL